jgi:hypothetical protein
MTGCSGVLVQTRIGQSSKWYGTAPSFVASPLWPCQAARRQYNTSDSALNKEIPMKLWPGIVTVTLLGLSVADCGAEFSPTREEIRKQPG